MDSGVALKSGRAQEGWICAKPITQHGWDRVGGHVPTRGYATENGQF